LQNNLECMQTRGHKQYHLSNHLGNVLVTLQDRKEPIIIGGGPVGSFADLYHPYIVTATDYYAFGGSMEGRSIDAENYKFGMNTQEKDDEVYGEGNSTTAEYWQYDSRLGRRWNVDPRPNVSISSYACFGNNPIFSADINGDTIKIEGTSEFKQATFNQLQALTNDLLAIDKDGIVTIVDGKEGTMNLEKKLIKGTQLIRHLNSKGHEGDHLVKILSSSTGCGLTVAKSEVNGYNGLGTSSTIYLNLNATDKNDDGSFRNTMLTLGHELIHASHNWTGSNKGNDVSLLVEPNTPLTSGIIKGKLIPNASIMWLRQEEVNTRSEDNEIRSEHGFVGVGNIRKDGMRITIKYLLNHLNPILSKSDYVLVMKSILKHPNNKIIPKE